MSQIKIYGLKTYFANRRNEISNVLHGCLVRKLSLPEEKRFHRFIGLDKEDFIYPEDRSEQYTIIEIDMFEGRSVETKKGLVRDIFEQFEVKLGISPTDVEITLHESPRENWGIRGLPGDELSLGYTVNK